MGIIIEITHYTIYRIILSRHDRTSLTEIHTASSLSMTSFYSRSFFVGHWWESHFDGAMCTYILDYNHTVEENNNINIPVG